MPAGSAANAVEVETDINPNNILLAPSSLLGLDYQGKVPTTYNYSLGIQYKLPWQFVLDTAYVGSLSRHQLDKVNINAIPYGTTFLPQNQDPTKAANSPNAVLGSNAYHTPATSRACSSWRFAYTSME